ncbi:MAG: hypothetical protein QXX38_00540 [Candidatus Aenigmatarchaeota archaeon]
MPVFARTKLLMEELCLTLRPRIDITYSGPNPQKAYEKLLDVLLNVLKVPRENIQEKVFKWERAPEGETFSSGMEVIKNFDKFSYMQLTISIGGFAKPSKEFGKEGRVSIEIEGVVRTEYPQDTTWERSFLYEIFRTFYHKVFYKEERRRYVEKCREWMFLIESELKSFFAMLPKMV